MHACSVATAVLGSCLNCEISCVCEVSLLQILVRAICAVRYSAKGLDVEMCDGRVPLGLARLKQRIDTGAWSES